MVTYKAQLNWQRWDEKSYRCYRAIVSHGTYEVRSSKRRNWTCWLNGRKMGQEAFTSYQLAIDAIEQAYYRDPRQLKAELNIVDRRTVR